MSHTYDSNYTPPFPVLPIILHNSKKELSVSCQKAHLDTGADSTIIPHTLPDKIESEEIDINYIQSHWGERRQISVHSIDIEVDGEYLSAIEVVRDDVGKEILIGRNVLNRLIILLDGFKNQTDVLTRHPQKF